MSRSHNEFQPDTMGAVNPAQTMLELADKHEAWPNVHLQPEENRKTVAVLRAAATAPVQVMAAGIEAQITMMHEALLASQAALCDGAFDGPRVDDALKQIAKAFSLRPSSDRSASVPVAVRESDLYVAWNSYVSLFGEAPHGTPTQMRALARLIPNKSAHPAIATPDDARGSGWQQNWSDAKKSGRILLGWKGIGSVGPHVELGKWSDAKQTWTNTYGHPFHGEPDGWAPLEPFVSAAYTPGAAAPDDAREALKEIVAADQQEKFVTIETDPAGNTMAVEIVDGPCAKIARRALAAIPHEREGK